MRATSAGMTARELIRFRPNVLLGASKKGVGSVEPPRTFGRSGISRPGRCKSTAPDNELLLFLSLEIAIGELARISAGTHSKRYPKNINGVD
jgi:hypothetical protein